MACVVRQSARCVNGGYESAFYTYLSVLYQMLPRFFLITSAELVHHFCRSFAPIRCATYVNRREKAQQAHIQHNWCLFSTHQEEISSVHV